MRRPNIRNRGDVIRLRNLIAYKVFRNSTKINRFISYKLPERKYGDYIFKSLIDITQINTELVSNEIRYAGKMAMENRFDLLGSGWVRYIESVRKIRENKKKYPQICWNIDIKTGYRWPEGFLDEKECIESPEGVDIKNVWELGRMNYLVPFALYILAATNHEKKAAICHYKNIVTDFMQSNPVGMGVNWVLPMEASIRVSNILISYDLIKQADKDGILGDKFSALMAQLVYAHIRFIWNNPEKNIFGGRNGNHYYSNIVGLLVAAGYIRKRDSFADKVFEYARKEFLKETKEQFYAGGGHFEQSTGYFRLTAEMAVFGAAILLRNGYDMPGDITDRLWNNSRLARDLRKTDGSFYSFGDCDSGRFIKTGMYGSYFSNEEAGNRFLNLEGYTAVYGTGDLYFWEDNSCLDSLIKYTEGLFGNGEREAESLEEQIIRQLSGGRIPVCPKTQDGIDMAGNGREEDFIPVKLDRDMIDRYPYKKVTELSFDLPDNRSWDASLYLKMGFYVLRNERSSLLFRFGNNEGAGHGHNDTLHYEYEVNKESCHADRGTYTYTGYPEIRNRYRSTAAHHVPYYGYEQREFMGLFGYGSADTREIVEYTDDSIAVRYVNKYCDHIRRIKRYDGKILVEDYGKSDYETYQGEPIDMSPAYGVIERAEKNDKNSVSNREDGLSKNSPLSS